MRQAALVLAVALSLGSLTACSSSSGTSTPSCDAECRSNLSAALGTDDPDALDTYVPTDYPTDDELSDFPTDDGLSDFPTDDDDSTPPDVPQFVRYRIVGTSGEASVITYTEGENSSIEQSTNASLPWKKRVTADGTFFSLSAQNNGGGSITCEIDGPDGSVLDKHTAHGLYAIADCQSS